MSTILDSLKKSSNNRDNNNKTSIDNFNFSSSNKSSKLGLIIIVFLIFVTAVILYFGYQYINEPLDGSQKSSDTALPNNQTPQQKTATNNSVLNKQNDTTTAKKIQKPDNKAVRKKLNQNKNDTKLKTKKDNRAIAQKVQTKEKAPLADSTSQDKNKSTTLGSTKKSSVATNNKPLKKLTVPNDKKNQEKPKFKAVVKKPEYTYVYQLPFSVRKEMPKFKLNIHIYDENPANQVAVINGVKFVVGDLIEEQVLIKSIVREGVLLEFNNHVFLLPNL